MVGREQGLLKKGGRGSSDCSTIPVAFDTAAVAADLYNRFYVEGDVSGALASMSDDVRVVEKGNPDLPSNGSVKGKEEVLQLINGVFSYQIYIEPRLLLELKSYHDSQEIWMNHLPD